MRPWLTWEDVALGGALLGAWVLVIVGVGVLAEILCWGLG
jgi:hypothetical protein